jgi:glycine dehydrogenase subunit 2
MNNYPHNLLSIEKSSNGRRGVKFTPAAKGAGQYLPQNLLRADEPKLPQLSELDAVRHFTNLSRLNIGLDTHFYPLGSCTMKYNPKAYEVLAGLDGFAGAHPCAPHEAAQGSLEVLYKLEETLKAITGFDAFTLQPAAGAHGEFTGALIAKAYYKARKDKARTEIIVPDTAHGTNPATAAMCGFSVISIKSASDGRVDIAELKKALGPKTALVMLTVPNTVGLFEKEIKQIADNVHAAGALIYMDGANFNALIGSVKPAELGADIMHINTHKTLSTPHGGGGPGAGAVGVIKSLEEFLPQGRVGFDGKKYAFLKPSRKSIGAVKSYWGNMAVLVRAYCYLRQFDNDTLRRISENAVLNANYIKAKLQDTYPAFFKDICMHECVFTLDSAKMNGVKTLDIAKRLLDLGFHAPTIYFPLLVPEALMVEPTETESKETMDKFAAAMKQIFNEAQTNPEALRKAPQNCPVKRIDEVGAAREPNLHW